MNTKLSEKIEFQLNIQCNLYVDAGFSTICSSENDKSRVMRLMRKTDAIDLYSIAIILTVTRV